VQQRLAASLENEKPVVCRLELLLPSVGEDDIYIVSGVHRILSKPNYDLSRDFLPPVPLVKAFSRLSQALDLPIKAHSRTNPPDLPRSKELLMLDLYLSLSHSQQPSPY
jgi:hypothetical protein